MFTAAKKHIKTSLGCVGFIGAVWRLQTPVTAEAHTVQDYSKNKSQGHKTRTKTTCCNQKRFTLCAIMYLSYCRIRQLSDELMPVLQMA